MLRSLTLRIPWLIVCSRLLLGPALIVAAARSAPGWALVAMLWAAVVGDILDGIIARRLGVATDLLRRCDSQADMAFFLCAAAACFVRAGGALRWWLPWIAALFALEAACYAVSYARFGREPCTHSYSAKAFGLALLAALTGALGWGTAGVLFGVMVGVGLLAQADCLLIGLTLRAWERDVPSCWHALRLRRGLPIRRRRLFHSA